MILPRALTSGSRVAVIAPGGRVVRERLDRGLAQLRSLGFEPVLGENVLKQSLHHAGLADERLSDLLWALTDPGIEGVICARGGEGATSLLPWLQAAEVDPRVFCGYSDITALHAWLQRMGWVTFHGPMVATEMADGGFDLNSFVGEVTGGRTRDEWEVRMLKPGHAEGLLSGGCLSLLCALSGTDWALPWAEGTVLLIEDVDEPPYRIHRMLTQLRDAQALRGVQGVVFGSMANCQPGSDDAFTLDAVILDALAGFPGPIGLGLPAGHCAEPMATFPLGTRVAISDAAQAGGGGRFRLLEPAVLEDVVLDVEV